MKQNGTNEIIDQRMVIAAECLANPDFRGTKDEIAQQAGVSRSTFYRWLRNDDFINLVNGLIDKYTNAELGMIWKSLLRQCELGNIQALRLYFEVKDRQRIQQEENLKIQLLEAQVAKLKAELKDEERESDGVTIIDDL